LITNCVLQLWKFSEIAQVVRWETREEERWARNPRGGRRS